MKSSLSTDTGRYVYPLKQKQKHAQTKKRLPNIYTAENCRLPPSASDFAIYFSAGPKFETHAEETGIELAPPTDLVYALTFGSLVFVFLRTASEPLFGKVAKYLLSASKASNQGRVDRFAICCFKLFAYLALSWYGYECLKEEDWFPRALGGTAPDAADTLNGWPHHTTEKMRYYYGSALAYHGHSIFYLLRDLVKGERRNDFYEMSIHHVVTTCLICASHLLGFNRIGAVVLFIHDISDICTYQIKSIVDMDRYVVFI